MAGRSWWNAAHGACAAMAVGCVLILSACAVPETAQPMAAKSESKHIYTEGRTVSLPPVPAKPTEAACKAWRAQMMAMPRDPSLDGLPGDGGAFFRPELMAIGDSLFNGVQSLRINWFLSEWSAPTLVAIRLGLIEEQRADRTGRRVFYGPQYKDYGAAPAAMTHYGLNLEALPDGLWDLSRMLKRQAEALDDLAFQYTPPNGRPFADNIAYLGANSFDLLHWTPADYRRHARPKLDGLKQGLLGAANVGDAVFHANAAFVLDPTNNPCLASMTPVAQVELRQPKRVLISIGANDGMYSLAFSNKPITANACDKPDMSASGKPNCVARPIQDALRTNYIQNVRELLKRLAAVPNLESVYLNSLPFPSRTANQVPFKKGRNWFWYNDLMSCPGTGPDDTSGKLSRSEQEVADADALINTVNDLLRAEIAAANQKAAGRVHFALVDVNARLGDYDAKRCDLTMDRADPKQCRADHGLALTKARFGGGDDVTLDNRPVRFSGETGARNGSGFKTKITEGGLLSFDNMHLSSVGYEVMADLIVKTMKKDSLILTDACPDNLKASAPPGACAALLTTPGWSYEDANRRDYSFLRTAGLEETNDREKLSARIHFLGGLLRVLPGAIPNPVCQMQGVAPQPGDNG